MSLYLRQGDVSVCDAWDVATGELLLWFHECAFFFSVRHATMSHDAGKESGCIPDGLIIPGRACTSQTWWLVSV